jgi:hypothetical protein
MPKAAYMNHVPGLYQSVCCGVERNMPDNMKFPPCPGGAKGEIRCDGPNASWMLIRATVRATHRAPDGLFC